MTSPSITDVPDILVGHAHDQAAMTGCTVVRARQGAVGGVDVRGGGPGTRETDLLNPLATVSVVHAICLCGGSAFGLAAASGVMRWLREQQIGYPTPAGVVPIVPAAVIYDLALGASDRYADEAMGYAAVATATSTTPEGCVGVGMGASAGKLLGMQTAVKTGIGSWSERLQDGTVIGALVVSNPFGEIVRVADGRILAGVRAQPGGFLPTIELLRRADVQQGFAALVPYNTTLAVVATDARLSKAEACKVAQMAHDGLARAIRPVHTPFDGDTVFALATGTRPPRHLTLLGSLAAEVLATAIERSATQAVGLAGLPSASEVEDG